MTPRSIRNRLENVRMPKETGGPGQLVPAVRSRSNTPRLFSYLKRRKRRGRGGGGGRDGCSYFIRDGILYALDYGGTQRVE